MLGQDFVDDPAIVNDDDLWRRVHPTQIVNDPNTGPRPSSGTFKDPELSVDVAKDTDIERALRDYCQHSLVAFKAGLARHLKQIVSYNRLEDNEAHALVIGPKPPRTAKKLAKESEWIEQREPFNS